MVKLMSGDISKIESETLIVPVCEDKGTYENKTLSDLEKKAKALNEFKGKKDDELTLYDINEVRTKRIIFLGLGKSEKITPETLRALCGSGVKKCIKKDLSRVLFAVPSEKILNLENTKAIKAMMEGSILANHIFDPYKTEKKQKPLSEITFNVEQNEIKNLKRLSADIETICRGTILAREWVSMPSNEKGPDQFAKIIKDHAAKEKLPCTILDDKRLEKEKFGGICAVAKGSTNKPKMAILEYKPVKAKKTIVLVGKGVTFDSGGINLKAPGFIEDMKSDMAGAAAVAATMFSIAKTKPELNLVGIMPLVENMPSGEASRPGDIIKSYSGKTVEIGNTDAEGRLILMDALAYAVKKYKPHTIINIATLTGACAVALGEKIAGVFSFDNDLAKAIVSSGESTFERCWQMPMPEDYKELLKSEFADIHNMSSSKYGGAIAGALFLSEFVNKTRWAHIDIAGPAYTKKPNAYCNAGGTGFGVRLLCDVLDKL
jgi:leucyl aminopeptidase